MSKRNYTLLIKQTEKLVSIGIELENKRDKLKKLVEQKVPYTSPEMLETLECFEKLEAQWKQLESEHLALKNKYSKP